MKIPVPGEPVRGSKSGQPIMALFDLLGRNWSMGILWILSDGPLNFRELQAKCESVSPTTLNTRLKELSISLLLAKSSDGYILTSLGKEWFGLMKPVGSFAKKWGSKLAHANNS